MSAEHTADVVVVGYGASGVCAALEARSRGADVLALDRFNGGGATEVSGGIVYAGGGTGYSAKPDSTTAPTRCSPTCTPRSATRSDPRPSAGSSSPVQR